MCEKNSLPNKLVQKTAFEFPTTPTKVKYLLYKELVVKSCWKVCWNCWSLLETHFHFPTCSNNSNSVLGFNVLNTSVVGMLETERRFLAAISIWSRFFFPKHLFFYVTPLKMLP